MNTQALVIDVNVFLCAMTADHVNQGDSLDFLRRVHPMNHGQPMTFREPPLFVLEMFAALNRRKSAIDVSLYPEFRIGIGPGPLPTVIESFTEEDVHELMQAHTRTFPNEHPFTKGADLEYLAIARKYGYALITWDLWLLKYGKRGFVT